MILKNIMEEKQLDLNRPFRSVRRIRRLPVAPPPPAAATSQCDDTDSRKIETSLPRLPTLPAYKPELKSGPIRNPGTVPFLWEQSPGRPKDESESKPRSNQQPPVAPKLPPGRILNVNHQSSDKGSEDKLRILNVDHQSSDKGSEDKLSSHSEDDSEIYADANDTLSRTESSLLNCSVSGLSGLDGSCVKPFRAFSDPQARDFMMGRFLPAAKAMASESPHYNTRKQDLNKTASVDKRQSLYQQRPTSAQAQHCEESEDDCDKELEYLSAKVCGLLPQFCPVPGLRLQGQVLVPSVPRSQAKPTEKPVKTHKNLREMLACKSTEWEVAEKTLYIDSNSRYSDTKETTQNDFEVLDKEETCSGDFRQDQDLVYDCKISTSSKMAQDESTDARKKPDSSSCLPLPPPLPKSPSESWLSRALTASSVRNQQHYNRVHASKTPPPLDPKWETIVKTSNAHHDRLRFSEELLAPIPEA